jgi:head-tail adaptor
MLSKRFMSETITIQRSTPVQGAGGEWVDSWATLATVDASLQGKTGNKSIANNVDAARYNPRVYIDVTDITEADRIVYNGQAYTIEFIDNNFNNHLQIDLKELK